MTSKRGPVGGAPELTARILALKDDVNLKFGRGIQIAKGITLGDLFDAFVALAAKAPQGVPAPSPRAYYHKAIDRVLEMRKLDLELAHDPALAKEQEYYLGRVHRCDDILFWLGHIESNPPAGEAAAPKEFTPENMPVVTVAGGAPPNASPPSWHRSLAEKAKDDDWHELSLEEIAGIEQGLADVAAGRVKSLEQIKSELAATGNFVERSKKAATEICEHLKLPYRWPEAKFLWLQNMIQGTCFSVREAVAAAPLAPLSGESPREFIVNEVTQNLGRLAKELNGGQYETVITHTIMPVACRAAISAFEAAGDRHASAERVRRETIDEVVYMLQGVQTDVVNRVDRGNIIDRVGLLRALPSANKESAQ